MTCKIKGAVLFDRDFMSAFAEVMEGVMLPEEECFTLFKIGNELGLAHQKLEEARNELMLEHCVKNNDGNPKIKKGEYVFKDVKVIEDVVMNMLQHGIELNCDLLDSDIFKKGLMKPAIIQARALLTPILKK